MSQTGTVKWWGAWLVLVAAIVWFVIEVGWASSIVISGGGVSGDGAAGPPGPAGSGQSNTWQLGSSSPITNDDLTVILAGGLTGVLSNYDGRARLVISNDVVGGQVMTALLKTNWTFNNDSYVDVPGLQLIFASTNKPWLALFHTTFNCDDDSSTCVFQMYLDNQVLSGSVVSAKATAGGGENTVSMHVLLENLVPGNHTLKIRTLNSDAQVFRVNPGNTSEKAARLTLIELSTGGGIGGGSIDSNAVNAIVGSTNSTTLTVINNTSNTLAGAMLQASNCAAGFGLTVLYPGGTTVEYGVNGTIVSVLASNNAYTGTSNDFTLSSVYIHDANATNEPPTWQQTTGAVAAATETILGATVENGEIVLTPGTNISLNGSSSPVSLDPEGAGSNVAIGTVGYTTNLVVLDPLNCNSNQLYITNGVVCNIKKLP